MRIGVISDTHNFFDPRLPLLFAGVDHILHGGDIGLPAIILALEQIAPVTAVAGNTDDPGLHNRLTEVVELASRRFFLQHIVNPQSLAEPIRTRIARSRPDVVVFGHTHEIVDGGLLEGDLKGQLFNPGTWLPSLDLSLAYVREKIREDGLSLDMLKDPTLYTKARRAVRIDANPGERASVSVVTC